MFGSIRQSEPSNGHNGRSASREAGPLDRSVRVLKVEGVCEKRARTPARRIYMDLSKDGVLEHSGADNTAGMLPAAAY